MNKKIFYPEASYSNEEILEVTKVLEENRLTLMDGPKVKELESKVAKRFNKKYGLMVNSGSSANLIGILSLKLKKGSKVYVEGKLQTNEKDGKYYTGIVANQMILLDSKGDVDMDSPTSNTTVSKDEDKPEEGIPF